jgi:hypothetical protein
MSDLPDRQLTLIETYRFFASGELSEREAEESVKALISEQVIEPAYATPEATSKEVMLKRLEEL